jgi:hypothetical protein
MERYGSRTVVVVAAILALTAISVVCLKPPRPPTWDTQITLPLFDKTFRVMDLLPKKYFTVAADSAIQFKAEAVIDTLHPIANLSLSGRQIATDFKLADLVLSDDYSSRVKLGLEDILGMSLPEQPERLPIPGFQFTLDRDFAVPRIRRAELLRGAAVVRLQNFANVTLDSARVGSGLLGDCRFRNVGPQTSQEDRRRLGGTVVEQQNRFVLTGGSRGSGAESLWVSRHDSVIVVVTLDSLRMASAELQVPKAQASKRVFLGVAANHPFILDSVIFAQGYAELDLVNDFNFPVDLALRVARLGFSDNVHLTPGSAQTARIDLAGKSLANSGLTNSLLEVLTQVSVVANTDYARITKEQKLSVTSNLEQLQPSYLQGELREPLYITPKQETLPRLFPTGLPAVRLPRCDLDLRIVSAVGFPGRLNIHIKGVNKAGDSATLDKTVYVAPGSVAYPRTTDYTIPLSRVLNIGAHDLRINYDIAVTGHGAIESQGYATGKAVVSTPLRLALCADTIDLGGRVVEIDQSLRDKIARYLVAGELYADVGNHFPLGMNACVVLRPDSGPTADSMRVGIPAGRVDQNRACQYQTDTTVVGTLDEQSLVIFHNPNIRARLLLYVPESDTVEIRHQDFLNVTTRAVLKLRIGGQP